MKKKHHDTPIPNSAPSWKTKKQQNEHIKKERENEAFERSFQKMMEQLDDLRRIFDGC